MTRPHRVIALALLAALVVLPARAVAGDGLEPGTLRGTVKDDDGERLSGANILLLGTTIGTSTDLDGEYRIEGVPPGEYEIRISFMGYDTKVVPNVLVEAGKTGKLNVELERSDATASYTIEDLVVTADRVLSTEVALITERMKSITIGDAISAERISKSPDGTGSDVLKRVTGLTVAENKFVFVRGTTDRYSVTWLDDVPVSATDTDVDRRSFTFDVIPASLLSSAVIVKTASPDLPGDFTGGLVRLNTRDIPTERGISISASGGFHQETTGKEIRRSQGGDTDWLGVDDGSRELPDYEYNAGNNYNNLARDLPNTWSQVFRKAPVNGSYSVSYGDRLDFGDDDGRHVLGIIAGAKYSASTERVEFIESPTDTSGYELLHKEGTKDRYKIAWSGLLNLSYSPSPRHRISARGLYVRDARDQVGYSEGNTTVNSGPGGRSYSMEWDERARYGLQVGGTHEFGRRSPEVSWKLFGSRSTAEEPDRRQADYQLRADGNRSISENSRSWSQLDEDARGFRTDVTVPLGLSKAKLGVYYEKRDRSFTTDSFFSDPSTIKSPNYWIRIAGLDTIFVADNYGPRKLTFRSQGAYTGEYSGTHQIDAYYAMIDHAFDLFGERFRFAGGARAEHSKQTVEAFATESSSEAVVSEIDKTDVLPSMSLTYMPKEWMNLRLAHFHSVNRPELREMADVKYHDFNEGVNVVGEPDLKRSYIRNYDVRLEAFPGADEVLAVSYFYKGIRNAIELKQIPSSDYKFVRTWFNSPRGHNHGFEVEARKSLGFLGGFFDDITVVMNYTRVFSAVEYLYEWRWKDEEGNWHTGRETREREMQGQAPWTVNAALVYDNPAIGLSVNVLYNRVARRLFSVASTRDGDIWEEPKDVLDLAIRKSLFGFMELKFAAKNLTQGDDVKTMGPEGLIHSTEYKGASYSLSLGLRL